MGILASMTGFGRARGALSQRFNGSVVVRSVNHRYLDIQVRTTLREELPEAEATVRGVLAGALQRGRVTVQLSLERTAASEAEVVVNTEAVTKLLAQLNDADLPDEAGRKVALKDVLALPGIVAVYAQETALNDDELVALGRITQEAAAALVAMRRQEGSSLKEQIMAELGQIRAFLDWLEPMLPEVRQRLLDRIKERLREVLGEDLSVDPDRLVTEAALQADRSDVAEEVVRLRSHLDRFAERLEAGGAVGRTLDFLCQEFNRELNTIGSKCREVGMVEHLVDARSATERIREQVQNLE